jgi:hypothetical protein
MSDKSDAKQEFVDIHTKRTLAETVPELREYLAAGSTVLDVGCGPGTITLGVAGTVAPGMVFGIDPVEFHIQTAAKLAVEQGVRNIKFQVGDGYSLPFADAAFDVVFSHTVLHYFYDPERAIKEQKRLARPGGWVVACGVRDWGLVRRFPPCPAWEALVEARARYAESRRNKPKPSGEDKMFGHTQAGRMCPGWFAAAGFTEIKMMVKPVFVAYTGADTMQPHPMDLLPWQEGDKAGYHAYYETEYGEMIAEGLLDKVDLDRAMQEARTWFNDPRAFHFHVTVTVAGRA